MMASKLPKTDKDCPNGPWCPLVLFLSVTKNKVTVFYDFYTSIIVEIYSILSTYSTNKYNSSNKKLG